MIWIDYAIITLVLISSVIGLLHGFVREAFSLVIWVVALGVGLSFSKDFSSLLTGMISYPSIRSAIAFLILFIATLIVGALLNYLLSGLVKTTGLTGSDRFIGMFFGIARGVIIVSIVVMLAGLTPLPEDSWWKESVLIPLFQSLAVWLGNYIPSGLADYMKY